MNKAIVESNKSGRCLPDERYGCVWELVAAATSPCQTFGFAYVEVDPGRESPPHLHRHTEELYYVVSGAGVITLDGEKTPVKPGSTVAIAIGVVHSIQASSEGLSLVCFSSPAYSADDDWEV